MRNVKEVLFAAVLLFTSVPAFAHETGCYFLASYGKAHVRYMGTTQLEDRLFAINDVIGSYTTYPDSRPHSFGLGCLFPKKIPFIDQLALEVVHREGLRADVISQVGVNLSAYSDVPRVSDTYELKRYAELEGYSATLVGTWKVAGPFSVNTKFGAMYGKAFLAVTSPAIPYSIEAVRRIEGLVPIGGVGITFSPQGKKWSLSLEEEAYWKYVNITSIVVRVRF